MRLILRLITLLYIAAIFILADSSMVKDLSRFNPYSLLHVPLYGILSLLLIFSISSSPKIPSIHLKEWFDQIQGNEKRFFYRAGMITLMVAMGDEIYQSCLPTRHASFLDLILDLLGTVLALSLLYYFLKKRNRSTQRA